MCIIAFFLIRLHLYCKLYSFPHLAVFNFIPTLAEEAKRPERNIPLSISISLLMVFLAYFGMSSVLTLAIPYCMEVMFYIFQFPFISIVLFLLLHIYIYLFFFYLFVFFFVCNVPNPLSKDCENRYIRSLSIKVRFPIVTLQQWIWTPNLILTFLCVCDWPLGKSFPSPLMAWINYNIRAVAVQHICTSPIKIENNKCLLT